MRRVEKSRMEGAAHLSMAGKLSTSGREPKRNLVGRKIGRLTVRSYAGRDSKSNVIWTCECDCGTIKNFFESKLLLKNKPTQSCGCQCVLPEGVSAMKKLYYGYKRDAAKRGHEFMLTIDQFKKLTSSECFYCGTAPSSRAGDIRNNGFYIFNGIDRVDNSIGYDTENVVPCCKRCNGMKSDTSKQDFLEHILKIVKRQKGGI